MPLDVRCSPYGYQVLQLNDFIAEHLDYAVNEIRGGLSKAPQRFLEIDWNSLDVHVLLRGWKLIVTWNDEISGSSSEFVRPHSFIKLAFRNPYEVACALGIPSNALIEDVLEYEKDYNKKMRTATAVVPSSASKFLDDAVKPKHSIDNEGLIRRISSAKGSSVYTGVTRMNHGRWAAHMVFKGKRMQIGPYATEREQR